MRERNIQIDTECETLFQRTGAMNKKNDHSMSTNNVHHNTVIFPRKPTPNKVLYITQCLFLENPGTLKRFCGYCTVLIALTNSSINSFFMAKKKKKMNFMLLRALENFILMYILSIPILK